MTDHVAWKRNALVVLDQRLLPFRKAYITCTTVAHVVSAIKGMAVRGAPLIGVVAAYGVVVGIQELMFRGKRVTRNDVARICQRLAATRPTAVNLTWALSRMEEAFSLFGDREDAYDSMLQAAVSIHVEDIENNRSMARYGAELIDDGDTVLTHCNAGSLATGGYGTALGVIRAAHESGKKIRVIATETRPYFQGARLTAWEMMEEGIPVQLVPDNHVGLLCSRGLVQKVIVGADRIARNGDVANKIGTYTVALAAHEHHVPFYVAAPLSTFDPSIKSGAEIEIEERDGKEVTMIHRRPITLRNIKARYFGFDVTPAHLITYIVTERGVLEKPFAKYIKLLFSGSHGHHNPAH